MNDYIKYDKLSNEIKKVVNNFHTKQQENNKDISLQESLNLWINNEMDSWLLERLNDPSGENKRKHIRLDVEITMNIVETLIESAPDDPNAKEFVGNLVNISKGGLYFCYNKPIEISSIIKVRLDLTRLDKSLENIEALAMVVRVDTLSDDEYGIGVMFSSIYDDDKFNLELFILKSLAYHLYTF